MGVNVHDTGLKVHYCAAVAQGVVSMAILQDRWEALTWAGAVILSMDMEVDLGLYIYGYASLRRWALQLLVHISNLFSHLFVQRQEWKNVQKTDKLDTNVMFALRKPG